MFGGFFGNNQAEASFFKNGLLLDGVNDRVSIEGGQLSLSREFGLSYSFWVYFSNETSGFPTITSANSSNAGLFFIASTYIGFYPTGYNTRCIFDYGYAANKNKRIHMALSITSSGIVELYIDSVLQVKTTSKICPINVPIAGIGRFNSSLTDGSFKIDEFSIFVGKTLSEEEIGILYNSGKGSEATNVGSPTLYWKFNESGETAVVPSAVIGGSDGVLENFTGDYWVSF